MKKPDHHPERLFTVVMRGPSAVRFQPKQVLHLANVRSEVGPVDIAYTSRWLKQGNGVVIPGHLWIEVRGKGESLGPLLAPFANAGWSFLPFLSLSANAAIGEPDIEIGFESTPGATERDFFQSYVLPESTVMHSTRRINGEATLALLQAISVHRDTERLKRAANQYRLALTSWKMGKESLSLVHLWMALEALTKVRIRSECSRRGSKSERDLAESLGILLDQLDPTVRRELILRGDVECYTKAKKASDGFEHGFLGYDDILELSKDVRDRMANYLRREIFELAGVDREFVKVLTEDPFDKPKGHWPLVKYFRGRLLGENQQLAAPGNAYPVLEWRPTTKKCEVRSDGGLDLQVEENFTARLGDGVILKPQSQETWDP